MNDLSKVEVSQLKETMTSVEIAELTGKSHDKVCRDIANLIEQGVSTANFGDSTYTTDRGRGYKCYVLTKKGCLILASGYHAVLREKIINRWEELEIKNKSNSLAFNIPQTFSQALMLAAKQAEQIEEQTKLIEEQKPKVEFFDAVADSKTAIQMNDVAKTLAIRGFGRNNLFEFLRNKNILMRNNQPYQKYVDCGYFRVIEQRYQKNNEECINIKTLVYQKGVDFIRKTILSNVSSIGKNNKELNN